jgi:hypothetical protein
MSGKSIDSCGELQCYETKSLALHAYIWSQKGAIAMAQASFLFVKETNKGDEVDIDLWMRDKFHTFSCYPQLVYQSDSESSNTTNHTSVLAEAVRCNIVPLLLKTHRNHCNAVDILAYTIWPILSCIFGLVFMIAAMVYLV